MYRISLVFDTPSAAIIKIAGQITDGDLDGWSDFVQEMNSEANRWIILDFCDVSRVDRQAAALLVKTLPKHVLLLNCPIGISNMVDSAGLRSHVLEASDANPSPREHRDVWEARFLASSSSTTT
jgi:anti-anti-sigma regulatory factor